jgi:DNA-binding CsgD family transcriptional regulator
MHRTDSSRFHADLLTHLIQTSYELLPPTECQSLFRELGICLGRHVWHQFTRTHPLTGGSQIKDLVQCIAGLEDLWGWSCTILQQADHSISVLASQLPLKLPLSSVAVGLFEGVAGEAFGSAKVTLKPTDGPARLGARIEIHIPERRTGSIPAGFSPGPRPASRGQHHRNEAGELGQLSVRERQVLRCVGEGFSNKQVAEQLGISVRTVEGHVSRICVKLDARRRAELIRFALRHQLASL